MFPRITKLKCGSYLFVRTFHTVLVIGVAASLGVKKTEVNVKLTSGTAEGLCYGLAFFGLVLAALIMYFVTCLVDPGFVPVIKERFEDSDEEETNVDIEESSSSLLKENEKDLELRKCGFCGIKQPLRARHCEECDRCVRKFDHHCPWLDTCIGENNHRYFLIFLSLTSCIITWGTVIVWHSFVRALYWAEWFRTNLVFLVDLAILLPGGVACWCLLGMHAYLAVCNQTTWEIVSRPRITYLNKFSEDVNPFHLGYLKNCYTFLHTRGVNRWEAVYRKYKSMTRDSA